MDRVKRIWYLSPMRAAKVQGSLRIRAVSPEPSLLAHTSSESWGTFRQKARSLAPLNGWACAVKICHDGMLEDTNSLDGAQIWVCHNYINSDNIRILHGCLVWIENSVSRVTVWHHEGRNFLSTPNTRVWLLFLHSPFNFGCFILKEALITTHNKVDVGHFWMWRHCDVAMMAMIST